MHVLATSRRALAVLVFLAAGGCGHVPAYDRARLAHPTMAVEDPTRAAEEHTRAVQEGAVGGGFSVGGGCGCN
ncbi:hypothetical protein BH09MYX1_BH09MYX1_44650 [soil metagenome]